jgi:hypothetical protein
MKVYDYVVVNMETEYIHGIIMDVIRRKTGKMEYLVKHRDKYGKIEFIYAPEDKIRSLEQRSLKSYM